MADPNLIIDQEHMVWYRAIIAFLTTTVVGLVVYMFARKEKEIDRLTEQNKEEDKSIGIRLVDMEIRIVKLEQRPYLTLEDLNSVVDRALDRVKADYGSQHEDIVNRLTDSMRNLRDDNIERVEHCNRALRAEMNHLTELTRETKDTLGRLLDHEGRGRKTPRD